MALYTIGDLHLSFSKNKPMSIFGTNWQNHSEKLQFINPAADRHVLSMHIPLFSNP